MSVEQCEDKLVDKQAIKHLAILLGIALAIGVYLIVTTVLISKDGVFYIERAQKFASDPVMIIKAHPPGYPFMILAAHKAISFFTHDNSNQAWIYSAQSVTLLCRLLALIALYFMGKLLVGNKNSFLALLILIFLPYPTKIVCDAVREWPYLLFLSTGFFFLLWAAKYRKWWSFGIVGFVSGLGYLVRPESGQLIIYTFLWAGVSLFRPKMWGVCRWKVIVAVGLLLLGFAMPVVPYMSHLGNILPAQVKNVMKTLSFNDAQDVMDEFQENSRFVINTAEVVPGKTLKWASETFSKVGESLMWFFLLPLTIGLYCRFRGNAKNDELFLMSTFILASITMMFLRFRFIQGHVSQRWTLPLVAFTVFYIPVGLRIMGDWLGSKFSQSKEKTDIGKDKRLSWFVILLILGIGICLPKLLRPVGIEKQGYRDVAKWLKNNTANEDRVFEPEDNRVSFYADRKRQIYLRDSEYVISIVGSSEKELQFNKKVEERYSIWVNKREMKKRIVIYEVQPKG